ncbi:hypothetical protein SASPL_150627 [Salvia splendens]|uniref:Disease resistance R13L4/SHOC-2-like LRR domain-containing protein n=1 Tax=Salvia splendens TaxID=180675 RepID=A0A8X8W6J5_SALSN|nr:hypothetical protein SASPL_150627 [Salvia splendens]
MQSLRHIYMCILINSEIDQLDNIETLTYFPVGNGTYRFTCIRKITKLRKLSIQEMHENVDVNDLFYELKSLKSLDCLILRGYRFRSMPNLHMLHVLESLTQLKLDGLITRPLRTTDFPPNISYLTLVDTCLNQDPMPTLGKLPKLFYLSLRNAYTGREMVITWDSFPELGVLILGELWNLRNVIVKRYTMPMLERLEINSCPYCQERFCRMV